MPALTMDTTIRARGSSRRVASATPVLLLALLAAGAIGWMIPRIEEREREAVDDALALAVREVATSQRAHSARTGEFFAGRRWMAAGQHERLVLPLAAGHRALTYYSRTQRGLVIVVEDVVQQRTCSVVVRMHRDDRSRRMTCGEEPVFG